jgi:hypothetical protein
MAGKYIFGAPTRKHKTVMSGDVASGHVWTAPSWQELSSRYRVGRCSHVFGLWMRFT